MPIQEGSPLADEIISSVNKPGEVSVIAITLRGTSTLTQPAPPHYRLASVDKLFIVATRAGLGQVLTRAAEHQRREPEPASPTHAR
ncbi:MAG: TrkA C-terminal domain-containing protein [Pseudonocardiaceae bacterium]